MRVPRKGFTRRARGTTERHREDDFGALTRAKRPMWVPVLLWGLRVNPFCAMARELLAVLAFTSRRHGKWRPNHFIWAGL